MVLCNDWNDPGIAMYRSGMEVGTATVCHTPAMSLWRILLMARMWILAHSSVQLRPMRVFRKLHRVSVISPPGKLRLAIILSVAASSAITLADAADFQSVTSKHCREVHIFNARVSMRIILITAVDPNASSQKPTQLYSTPVAKY